MAPCAEQLVDGCGMPGANFAFLADKRAGRASEIFQLLHRFQRGFWLGEMSETDESVPSGDCPV